MGNSKYAGPPSNVPLTTSENNKVCTTCILQCCLCTRPCCLWIFTTTVIRQVLVWLLLYTYTLVQYHFTTKLAICSHILWFFCFQNYMGFYMYALGRFASMCIPSSPWYQVPIPLGSGITQNASIATLTERLCVHEQSMNHIFMGKKAGLDVMWEAFDQY